MDSAEVWRWVWLGLGVLFVVGEVAIAGAFFMLPFGIGGLAAAGVVFATGNVPVSWITFLVVSVATFAALFPLGRRLDRTSGQTGVAVGASRWVGRFAHVLQEIPSGPGQTGLVRVDREEWRAESARGAAIAPGSLVKVVEIDGTRLIVEPAEAEGRDPSSTSAPGGTS